MWNQICTLAELRENSGAGALVDDQQVALFYLPHTKQQVFALDNWDPIGQAFVISRGIVGDIKGQPVVASPLYKQHFSLETGVCLEQPEVQLKRWQVEIRDDQVWLAA